MLCKQLYETTDPALRTEAEKTLVQFSASPDCLNKCQLLLERNNVSIFFLSENDVPTHESFLVSNCFADYCVVCNSEFRVMWCCLSMQSPYAQLLAATTLTKLVSRPNIVLPLEQRIDISKQAPKCWYQSVIVYTDEAWGKGWLLESTVLVINCTSKLYWNACIFMHKFFKTAVL